MIPKIKIIENIEDNKDLKFSTFLQDYYFECLLIIKAPNLRTKKVPNKLSYKRIENYNLCLGIYIDEQQDFCVLLCQEQKGFVSCEELDCLAEYLRPLESLAKAANEWIKKQTVSQKGGKSTEPKCFQHKPTNGEPLPVPPPQN